METKYSKKVQLQLEQRHKVGRSTRAIGLIN